MTDYVKHHGSTLEFLSSNSWVILNPIEKRIKEKIERVGRPLKDWDISINYGIKTGCNEAFIINKAKRDEIIAEDEKSAEIIRPYILGNQNSRSTANSVYYGDNRIKRNCTAYAELAVFKASI